MCAASAFCVSLLDFTSLIMKSWCMQQNNLWQVLLKMDSTALPVTLITHKVKAVWQKIFRAFDHVKL